MRAKMTIVVTYELDEDVIFAPWEILEIDIKQKRRELESVFDLPDAQIEVEGSILEQK